MKKENLTKQLMPLNLQFFAEGGDDGGDGGEGKDTKEGKEGKETKEGVKTKEVDVEKVKNDAIAEYLKSLGVEDSEALQGIVTKHNEDVKKSKTDLENKDDELKQTTAELKKEREARIKAEAKAEAMALGAKLDVVDDLVILAMAKVTKEKGVKEVLAEMKEGASASSYFVTNDEEDEEKNKRNKNVTNTRVKKRTDKEYKEDKYDKDGRHKGSMAERLLAQRKSPKNHYFK